jgi:hypothetical protein
VLLPGGFLLGGFFSHGGDPGPAVFAVPLGAGALFFAIFTVARSLPKGPT